MKNKIVSYAPGKLILMGEHAVVYGEPAIAGVVDLGSECVIEDLGENKVIYEAKDVDQKGSINGVDLGEKSGSGKLVEEGIKIALREWGFEGLRVKISSDLPIGSGMGSSASVLTSLIGGLGKALGREFELEDLNRLAFEGEKFAHGKPSGIDNTVVVYGGLMVFQKKDGRFGKEVLRGAESLKDIFLIQSGVPVESTKEMVMKVKKEGKKEVIKGIGRLVRRMMREWDEGEVGFEWMRKNERLLEELGVVGAKAKLMVREIENIGGLAKISGAGGLKAGSGIIIGYHKDKNKLKSLIKRRAWESYKVNIGGEGWQIK